MDLYFVCRWILIDGAARIRRHSYGYRHIGRTPASYAHHWQNSLLWVGHPPHPPSQQTNNMLFDLVTVNKHNHPPK
jgi:hypothetical protein